MLLKRSQFISLLFFFLISLSLLSTSAHADGVVESRPRRSRHSVHKAEGPVPAPSCVSRSPARKIELLSYNPDQRASKIIGAIQECSTTMFDVLRLLSGPNTIGLKYPEEKEQWGYLWLWAYKLQNPIGETVIQMDQPGKRIQKGKNPVELYITFNEHDVVERVDMHFIKKKSSQYVLFP
ncbi:MAG TPA: hypothetical protein DF383_13390 [Deltaproteobacteria bacterium]|nr:hypothetical protein [Deltaproteobacteria bacterium]